MKQLFAAGLAAILALLIAGCASVTRFVEESPTTARLAVQYATLKVIENSSDISASDVIRNVDRARALITNAGSITLAALSAEVRKGIRWDRLDTADALLLDAVLTEAEAQLWQRIGDGEMSAEAKTTISTLLDWIEQSAQLMRSAGRLGIPDRAFAIHYGGGLHGIRDQG